MTIINLATEEMCPMNAVVSLV